MAPALAALLAPSPAIAEVGAYESSWTHRALALQYDLGGDLGLRDAPWVGTHNSFNSRAEMGLTLSTVDSNQQLSLLDQLELDVRGLELDLHWFPSLRSRGFAPVVCHAVSGRQASLGCSTEKELGPVLDEIAAWLRSHPDQVLLLYLDDKLEGGGHAASALTLLGRLGGAIYRPRAPTPTCRKLPLDLSRDDVRRAGSQVIVVSDCDQDATWRSVVFDWSNRVESRPHAYADFPACDPRIDRRTYERTLVRYFEDSTRVGAVAEPGERITPVTAGRLVRCGVDMLGLDQLLPADGRLEALVWSWAEGEPRAGSTDRCAIQRLDARWRTLPCSAHRRVACRSRSGGWHVPRRRVVARWARRLCRERGWSHAVPRTGYEGQLLRVAMSRGRARSVWLGYRRHGVGWVALDGR